MHGFGMYVYIVFFRLVLCLTFHIWFVFFSLLVKARFQTYIDISYIFGSLNSVYIKILKNYYPFILKNIKKLWFILYFKRKILIYSQWKWSCQAFTSQSLPREWTIEMVRSIRIPLCINISIHYLTFRISKIFEICDTKSDIKI